MSFKNIFSMGLVCMSLLLLSILSSGEVLGKGLGNKQIFVCQAIGGGQSQGNSNKNDRDNGKNNFGKKNNNFSMDKGGREGNKSGGRKGNQKGNRNNNPHKPLLDRSN